MHDILRMGHPLLSRPSKKVTEFNTPELEVLINTLLEMRHYYQGAGLAAPQIGVDLQVICFGGLNNRYKESVTMPDTIVLINPLFEPLTTEMVDGWEGCLSVPGLRGLVPRYKKIAYTGFDIEGNRVEDIVEGFAARVVQHECDHVHGVLFPERIKDMKYFGFEDELKAFEEIGIA